MQITIKLRLRDKHAAELDRQARAVSFVWNYCNEVQKAARARRPRLSAIDLMRLTAGAGEEFALHAHTIQRVCWAYDDARKTQRKAWLRWREAELLNFTKPWDRSRDGSPNRLDALVWGRRGCPRP